MTFSPLGAGGSRHPQMGCRSQVGVFRGYGTFQHGFKQLTTLFMSVLDGRSIGGIARVGRLAAECCSGR
ncbi:hypothetical protein TgHK011_005616 [Trichoderma gracile]|nr:hypothetical protein TgHK011_005616 [Trichoderma gracile]